MAQQSTSIHAALAGMLKAKKFEPFIRHVRFPLYRNLREGLRIEFTHPITALVGPNGTNKTAILRALQGCPDYYNVGNYWYSTSLDPISDSERHRFIHGYIAPTSGSLVESVKTRIAKDENPDYFEPSRPLLSDGMKRPLRPKPGTKLPPERSATRWRAIQKKVTYLDFRSELSAYDKYFFHAPHAREREQVVISGRKASVRRKSPHLSESIITGRKRHLYYGSERIVEAAKEASVEQRAAISEILGRKYDSIKFITHRYYNVEGTTVILGSFNHQYSEAFAGSGEFAVAVMVKKIMEAPAASLILLDEPEVSLHPRAQQRLMDFLAGQAKAMLHQIIISTHSPEIVRDLPANAIKVLQQSELDGKVELVSQESEPSEAFFRLGVLLPKNKTIYVEDRLAASIVRQAIRPLGEPLNATVDILPLPGGTDGIQVRFIPSFALARNQKALVLLDGDQRTEDRPSDPTAVADADLLSVLKKLLHGNPQISPNGAKGVATDGERLAQLRQVLVWTHSHMGYLPGTTPEALLLEMAGLANGAQSGKITWLELTRESLGRKTWDPDPVTAAEIITKQQMVLAGVDPGCQQLTEIRERVKQFLTESPG